METAASDLAVLLEAQQSRKDDFEADMEHRQNAFNEKLQAQREQWERKQEQQKQSNQEQEQQLKKQRQREKEEFEYAFAREKKNEETI